MYSHLFTKIFTLITDISGAYLKKQKLKAKIQLEFSDNFVQPGRFFLSPLGTLR